ncbi:GFA family protein [Allosphingosinicella deserti]|uniref:Aldehyde-activating protein n=1 Tax=Allosphingosinicella deserti TaxID=2116704 RepID=A0A2P7QRJ4_9SPHN|nr:GFA family protein [Sphingomonas deserti]PSJ40569.1 aldehyde-activating protein [Sphingomonas deserti]
MAEFMEGGCACGRVRFRARVDNDEAYLCHCRMCQRATGSVSIAFKGMKKADVVWTKGPDWYQSSPIAQRPFCRDCGTSLGFAFPDSDTMDLTVAAFDDPARFVPTRHFGVESMHRAWLNTDGLPEMRSEDNPEVAERWARVTNDRPA